MLLECDASNAIQYLKDIGLLRSTMKCNSCGRDMSWSADPTVSDKFRWRCHKSVAGKRCYTYTSIRLGSWFQPGNLTLQEIMLLTYDIVRRDKPTTIREENSHGTHTVADWGMFCRETMQVFLEGSSVKIGGPNKTVEIDESKFGRRKY